MGGNMPRKNREQQLREELNQLRHTRCALVLPEYEKRALVNEARDPEDLAKRLSVAFPSLSVRIEFKGGHGQVWAVPKYDTLDVHRDTYHQQNNPDSFDKSVAREFPTREVVEGWLLAYHELTRKIRELKQNLEDEKRKNRRDDRYIMPHPMMFGWGR
jgi:hypothetical protein